MNYHIPPSLGYVLVSIYFVLAGHTPFNSGFVISRILGLVFMNIVIGLVLFLLRKYQR